MTDSEGAAHGTVFIDSLPIAGKTSTTETGEARASHAWFAGYVPADQPKLAFVIVLEHAGDAATAAGPIAKRLVLRMDQLGMLSQQSSPCHTRQRDYNQPRSRMLGIDKTSGG